MNVTPWPSTVAEAWSSSAAASSTNSAARNKRLRGTFRSYSGPTSNTPERRPWVWAGRCSRRSALGWCGCRGGRLVVVAEHPQDGRGWGATFLHEPEAEPVVKDPGTSRQLKWLPLHHRDSQPLGDRCIAVLLHDDEHAAIRSACDHAVLCHVAAEWLHCAVPRPRRSCRRDSHGTAPWRRRARVAPGVDLHRNRIAR